MKKSRFLLIIILLLASPLLFSLDIYLNDILWHSYSPSDLRDLKIELSRGMKEQQGIPLAEILPLMTELNGIRIIIPSGDILLNEDIHSLRNAKLLSPDVLAESQEEGFWQLSMSNSLYYNPTRIEIYGTAFPRKDLILWAEPGLAALDKQIAVWSSLHKVDVEYREVQNISTELIHREMTGDLIPDFILIFQPPDEVLDEEKTCAYALQSTLVPGMIEKTETLVLPSGYRIHPDLFMSILASLSERTSPFDPGLLTDKESLKKAARLYLDQILNHRFMEQDDCFLSETYRNRNIAFFPARSFPLQSGRTLALPQLEGMERPLPARIFPLILKTTGRNIPEGALLDFLKLPGVQYNLLSSEHRQIPSDTASLEDRILDDASRKVYEEWKKGFILSDRNAAFFNAVRMKLPDITRQEEDLIP
jgi:hypothetical protein